MALPRSVNSYPDCFDFCEKCSEDSVGARKPFRHREEAFHFRNRCNRFRQLTREQNKEIYPPDDKRHGTSDYDELVFTIEPGADGWWWCYGKKLSVGLDDVESLSEIEDEENGNKASA